MNQDISKTSSPVDLNNLSINTIRFLSVDAVQKANSGHPGLPMGAAPSLHTFYGRFLKHNPFGASAPGSVVMKEYDSNIDNVTQKAFALMVSERGQQCILDS